MRPPGDGRRTIDGAETGYRRHATAEFPVKPYMPVIVIVLVFVGLFGAGYIGASLFESPQAAFDRKVGEKVEEAQRLLARYEAGAPQLLAALQTLPEPAPETAAAQPAGDAAATQPDAAANPDVDAPAPEPAPDAGSASVVDTQALENRRSELGRQLTQMGGNPSKAAGGAGSVEDLQQRLQANAELLNRALQAIREAINTTDESDSGLRGSGNPSATRLETILLYHQADLLRRRATVHRAVADAERHRLAEVVANWHAANNLVRSLEREVAGMQGETIGGGAAAPADAAPAQPAQPAARAPAAAQPPRPRRSGRGRISQMFRAIGGGAAPAPDAEPPAPDEPAPAPAVEPQPQPVEQPPAARAAITIEKVPSLDERIAALEAQGKQADSEIAAARKDVEQLTAAIDKLQAGLKGAQSKAQEAERRMMQLEDAGIDASDPKALDRFINQYRNASRTFRESSREAAALEGGVVRNARPDAQEENEVLTAPLVAQDGEMKPEVGVVSLQADLRAAQALVEMRTQLRALVDQQIKELTARREGVTARLAKARAWRDGLVKEATQRLAGAIASAVAAEKLEQEAIDLLTGPAQQAAQRAQQAAESRVSEVQTFYRQNSPTTPAPQVTFLPGHARALAGDLNHELALIYAQRYNGLTRHERALASAAQMGIDPAALLPKQDETTPRAQPAGESTDENGENAADEAPRPAGTPTTQPQGIVQAATEARDQAIKAAEAALKDYSEADEQLKQLWVLHTQMGAVQYMLATLVSDPAQAEKHRQAALREYQLATRDRADRIEAQAYRPIIDSLTAAKPQ